MLPTWCCWNHLHKFSYYVNAPRFSTSCSKTDSCFWTKNQFCFALLDVWYMGGGGGGRRRRRKQPNTKNCHENKLCFSSEGVFSLPLLHSLECFRLILTLLFCPAVSSQCNLPCNIFTGVESLYQPQIAFSLADKKHFQKAKLSPFQRHL